MALYVVRRQNEHYPLSTWLEDDEYGRVEPVKVITDHGVTKVLAYYGVCMPIELVREHIVQIMEVGYDHVGIREEVKLNA